MTKPPPTRARANAASAGSATCLCASRSRVITEPRKRHRHQTTHLWVAIGKVLEAGDILAADQETALYGMIGLRLPQGVEVVSQPFGLHSDTGYAPRAEQPFASGPPRRRTIMVLGDGGAQMSAHELGTPRAQWSRPPHLRTQQPRIPHLSANPCEQSRNMTANCQPSWERPAA
jgi:TPP-dependent 2-oxoacid decarboxylase